jgi:hypothetical protein
MSVMFDKMVKEQSKSLASQKKFEKQEEQQQKKEAENNKLASVTSVTSGQLAIINCWMLGPSFLQKVIKKEDAEGTASWRFSLQNQNGRSTMTMAQSQTTI